MMSTSSGDWQSASGGHRAVGVDILTDLWYLFIDAGMGNMYP